MKIASICISLILISTLKIVHGDVTQHCPNFPWIDIRLPTWVDPTLYELLVHPDLNTYTFNGSVKIHVNVSNTETDLVILHKNPELNVKLAQVEVNSPISRSQEEVISYENVGYCETTEQLAIRLSGKQSLGTHLIFSFRFNGVIKNDLIGLYRSPYLQNDGTIHPSVLTQLEGCFARNIFPCFDEPSFKARFKVKVVREPEYQALSNMELLHSYDYQEGLICDVFDTSLKMSTYILAFAVGKFDTYQDSTPNGVNITVYTDIGKADTAKFAAETAIKSLKVYEEYFSIPYQMKKCDFLATAQFLHAAMENWGLIVAKEPYLLFDPEKSSRSQKEFIAVTVAHELAHQWFGNMVTMKWWDDLWLNEGFAALMEKLVVDKIYPDWNFMDRTFFTEAFMTSVSLDGFESTHEITAEIGYPEDVEEAFDMITYKKSSCIIRMFQTYLGNRAFQNGLKDYFEEFAYKNAEGKDLWKALGKYINKDSNKDFQKIADEWVSKPGIPYIEISLNEDKSQGIITQKGRYYHLQEERKQPEELWTIPVSFVTNLNSSHQEKVWLDEENPQIIDFPNPIEWIKLNPENSGYYLSFYSDNIYSSFATVFRNNPSILSAQDRLSLLYDASLSINAGYSSSSVFLNLIDAFTQSGNRDLLPFSFILSELEKMQRKLMYDAEAHKDIAKYRKALIEPLYEDSLWHLSNDVMTQLFQVRIIEEACKLGIPACVTKAVDLFDHSLKTGKESIHVELEDIAIATWIRHADEAKYEMALQRFLGATSTPADSKMILQALSKTENTDLLSRFFTAVFDKNSVKKGTMMSAYSTIEPNRPDIVELVWNVTTKNWGRIGNLIKNNQYKGAIIRNSIKNFATEEKLKEVKEFFADKALVGKGLLDYKKGIQSIKLNIQWLRLNRENVKIWLKYWKLNEKNSGV